MPKVRATASLGGWRLGDFGRAKETSRGGKNPGGGGGVGGTSTFRCLVRVLLIV